MYNGPDVRPDIETAFGVTAGETKQDHKWHSTDNTHRHLNEDGYCVHEEPVTEGCHPDCGYIIPNNWGF